MSLPASHHHLFTKSPSRLILHFTTTTNKLTNFSLPIASRHVNTSPFKPHNPSNFTFKSRGFTIKSYLSEDAIPSRAAEDFVNLDALLSFAEVICVVSSAVVAVSYAVNCTVVLGSKRTVFWGLLGSGKAFAWGLVALATGVAIGAWIRRRQWRRICRETVRGGGRESVNLVERIEKLEEDLKSSTTIIRVLSRQLEKLGIRFRLTRKALKEPMAETAALAQKNSEATRALAVQEDILEKELGEIQKVLLAMQEQQQKQLELILAIGKNGKLFESRRDPTREQDMIEASGSTEGMKQLETQETQVSGASKGTNDDRP